MDISKLEGALRAAIVTKQEGLTFSVSLDGKKVIKEVVMEALREVVASSENKYDDSLLAFVEPYVDAYLMGK